MSGRERDILTGRSYQLNAGMLIYGGDLPEGGVNLWLPVKQDVHYPPILQDKLIEEEQRRREGKWDERVGGKAVPTSK